MAPVVWGLDLAEIKWSKFGNKNMWSTDYHLRRTKFIIYQCALIFPVVSESLGTAALSAYVDAQEKVQKLDPRVYVYNNNFVGAASYNIWCGVYVAFVFGAAFFFDLIWPERKESKGVRLAWKICGVLACLFTCADAFTLTMIVALKCGYFRGADMAYGESLLRQSHKDGGAPLCYRHQGRAIASVVFVWPGFLFTVWSCVLLFLSIRNVEYGPGPKSAHARRADNEAATAEAQMSGTTTEKETPSSEEDPITNPPVAHRVVDTTTPYATPMAENTATTHAPAHTGAATTTT